jgi:hypothetical protein
VADNDQDIVSVYATGGSAGYGSSLLGSLESLGGHVRFTPSRQLRDAILKAEGSRVSLEREPRTVEVR